MFHVTSSRNRDSIETHGLDWSRMGAAPGIAGSRAPEQPGCFLCLDEFEMEWFVDTINNTGGTVDAWVVDGVAEGELVEASGGFFYLPRTVEPEQLTADLRSPVVEPSIYEAMGGAQAVVALAEAWHRRCLADSILSHPFEGGVHPQHTERLAAYWAEQLGGPATYTESIGDYSTVARMHSGNGLHEQMDGRAVAAFALALDHVGIPADTSLRFQLIAWFTWATAMLNHRWAEPEDVPNDLPLPGWNWQGTEGW